MLSEAQLARVISVAAARNRLFMEALKSPFFPLYRALRAHLAADPIGAIGFVRAGHADASRDPATYPTYKRELGGGGLMGIGPYPAVLALDFLGPLQSVHAVGRTGGGVDALALVSTVHERGFAQLHTGLDLSSEGDALISGARGHVRLHANWWSPQRATISYVEGGRRVELDEPFIAGGFNYEIAHFCELIRAGVRDSPVVSHNMSLGMARLLEAARRQLGVENEGDA